MECRGSAWLPNEINSLIKIYAGMGLFTFLGHRYGGFR